MKNRVTNNQNAAHPVIVRPFKLCLHGHISRGRHKAFAQKQSSPHLNLSALPAQNAFRFPTDRKQPATAAAHPGRLGDNTILQNPLRRAAPGTIKLFKHTHRNNRLPGMTASQTNSLAAQMIVPLALFFRETHHPRLRLVYRGLVTRNPHFVVPAVTAANPTTFCQIHYCH